jgi:folate-binding protein YgfZ
MSSTYTVINDCTIFRVSGNDARSYLNARLTNNIKTLKDTFLLAAALNPVGRCEVLMMIGGVPESEDFLIVVDSGGADEIKAAILRYRVTERVSLTDLKESHTLIHLLGEKVDLPPEGIAFKRQRVGNLGLDAIIPSELVPTFLSSIPHHHLLEGALEKERIWSGIPRFPLELNSTRLFLESPYLTAIAFGKGCYPGQEVVEKIESKGVVPSLMRRFEGRGLIEIGAKISNIEGKVIGEVLSATFKDELKMSAGIATVRSSQDISAPLELVDGKEIILEAITIGREA